MCSRFNAPIDSKLSTQTRTFEFWDINLESSGIVTIEANIDCSHCAEMEAAEFRWSSQAIFKIERKLNFKYIWKNEMSWIIGKIFFLMCLFHVVTESERSRVKVIIPATGYKMKEWTVQIFQITTHSSVGTRDKAEKQKARAVIGCMKGRCNASTVKCWMRVRAKGRTS